MVKQIERVTSELADASFWISDTLSQGYPQLLVLVLALCFDAILLTCRKQCIR